MFYSAVFPFFPLLNKSIYFLFKEFYEVVWRTTWRKNMVTILQMREKMRQREVIYSESPNSQPLKQN